MISEIVRCAGYVSVARARTPAPSIPCYVARTFLWEACVENKVKSPSDEQREREDGEDKGEHFSSFGLGNASYSYIA
jgi:hypothetical protein